MLQLILLISSASPPASPAKRSTPVQAVPGRQRRRSSCRLPARLGGARGPRPAPFPAAEERQEHLWSFAFRQTTQRQQTGVRATGRSDPAGQEPALTLAARDSPGQPLAGSKGQEGADPAPAPAPSCFRKAGWCRRGQSLGLSPHCRLQRRAPEPRCRPCPDRHVEGSAAEQLQGSRPRCLCFKTAKWRSSLVLWGES